VLIYQLPDFQQIGYISLPCFNDVHHVTPASDGNLLVVSTGLEMVVKVSPRGEVLAEWNVLGEDPWARFSRAIDYRKVETTKPHVSHPNFVFELDGEVWVTRFHQHDAVSLNGTKRRIEIAGEGVHDGLAWGERLLFTAVDGKIVAVDGHSLQVEMVVDLRQIQDRDQLVLPAWCRGLLPVDEAFSQFPEQDRIVVGTVLQNAFAAFEGEVQPVEIRVALFEFVDHPQRLQIVFEAAEILHAFVQRILSGVSEGRMSQVMREANRLGQHLVEIERPGDRARDLRHLERMRQARAIVVALVVDEHLGLVREPAKRSAMDDAVAIAAKIVTCRAWWLIVEAAATGSRVCGPRGT